MTGPVSPASWGPTTYQVVPGARRFESLALAGCAFGVVGVYALGVSLGYSDVDVWGAFVVPTILLVITVPLLARSRWLREEGLVGIASIALVAKFIGSYLRYLLAWFVYSGNDSGRYHRVGSQIATDVLEGQRSIWSLWPTGTSTAFIEQMNGIVALVSGRSMLASFMIFSWLSYLGLLGFIAAARRAVPGLRVRGYAIAVLFLPSMVFWPSSLGKDAWMVFGMGVMAVGIARLLTGSLSGSLWFVAGGYATALVRPHVTALLLAGLAVGFVGRQGGDRRPAYLSLLVLAGGLAAVVSALASDVLPNFDAGLSAVLEETQRRSSQGGSEIEVVAPNSPLDYPAALVTVLFRPFLFESLNGIQVLSALEGTVLFLWVMTRWRRLRNAVRSAAEISYLRFAFVYVLGFGFAWSSVGNLGIIARQRVQVLPLLLVVFFVGSRVAERAQSVPDSNAALESVQ